MILKHLATATALALAASATLALAEPPEEGQPGKDKAKGPRPLMPPPLVAALDADRNRQLDAAEIANADVALKSLDKNNDGEITREELIPRPPGEGRGPGKPHGQHPDEPRKPKGEAGKHKPNAPGKADRPKRQAPPLMQALDGNKDGKLDATELNNASNALRSLDKNSDGKLTPDEFIGRPPKGDGPDKGPKGPKGPGAGPGAPEPPGA